LNPWRGVSNSWPLGGSGEDAVKPYPVTEDLMGPALRVPRGPRVVAPGGTVHVVARCHNRECSLSVLTMTPFGPASTCNRLETAGPPCLWRTEWCPLGRER
jgi:hypothetical protein